MESAEYIPCVPSPDCPVRGCPTEDEHHIFYPGNTYYGVIEKTFRNLPENKVTMCRRMHNFLHAIEQPPVKPSRQEMTEAIIDADMAGAICLSATKRRMVYGNIS